MKLSSISISKQPPIQNVSFSNISDTAVLAGPNGVGKTSILNALLNFFRNPKSNQNVVCIVEATSNEERKLWSNRTQLNTAIQEEANLLSQFMQRRQKRGQLKSTVLNFESSRMFENIDNYGFSWDFSDPFQQEMEWNYSYNSARSRFQDVVHSLYRKIRSQKEDIAAQALSFQRSGKREMALDFEDPIRKFKEAFSKLLPGKTLCELDEKNQGLTFMFNDTKIGFQQLSSGEREVVTVVFDFLLRAPSDSIIIFDEPELHLHPELSYRLLRTLRDSGERNQFIFCTHSADIISASLDQTVVFIGPAKSDSQNQAVVVNEDDDCAKVLHVLGQSVGVISLGRKIVLIEGSDSSLDKQTYGAILGNAANEVVLVPTGGKDTINSFVSAVDTVLDKTIWGIEFFMLCDGDATVGVKQAANQRLKKLPRYHIENYFLDKNLLANVIKISGESAESALANPEEIENKLRALAMERISHAVALRVSHKVRTECGNVDIMPSGCHSLPVAELQLLFNKHIGSEKSRVLSSLDEKKVEDLIGQEYAAIERSFSSGDDWKRVIPGKPLLKKFAAYAKLDYTRLKTIYIRESLKAPIDPFAEVRSIFGSFA